MKKPTKTFTYKIVVKMNGKKSICNRIHKNYIDRIRYFMNEPMEWCFQNKNERGEVVDIRWDLSTEYMRRERKPNRELDGAPDLQK